MKTLSTLSLAALLLLEVSVSSFSGETKKNATPSQVSSTNTQIVIRHLKLRFRAYPST